MRFISFVNQLFLAGEGSWPIFPETWKDRTTTRRRSRKSWQFSGSRSGTTWYYYELNPPSERIVINRNHSRRKNYKRSTRDGCIPKSSWTRPTHFKSRSKPLRIIIISKKYDFQINTPKLKLQTETIHKRNILKIKIKGLKSGWNSITGSRPNGFIAFIIVTSSTTIRQSTNCPKATETERRYLKIKYFRIGQFSLSTWSKSFIIGGARRRTYYEVSVNYPLMCTNDFLMADSSLISQMMPLPSSGHDERATMSKETLERYEPADVNGCRTMRLDEDEPMINNTTSA